MRFIRNAILGSIMLTASVMASVVAPVRALEAGDFPVSGYHVMATPHGFAALVKRLNAAIKSNGMFAVSRASASAGASGRGITIPGNMIIGVYRNDFAVRMLEASIPAGIEAPLIFYVTENADGTATLSYRAPSATFAPYGSAALDEMAGELDILFAKIAAAAIK